MDWIISGIFGWCGTGWPRHFHGGGGGGGGDPDPWPPNCPMCGGVIGALSGIVINLIVAGRVAESGFFATAALAFAAGYAGNSLIGGIVGRMRAK